MKLRTFIVHRTFIVVLQAPGKYKARAEKGEMRSNWKEVVVPEWKPSQKRPHFVDFTLDVQDSRYVQGGPKETPHLTLN